MNLLFYRLSTNALLSLYLTSLFLKNLKHDASKFYCTSSYIYITLYSFSFTIFLLYDAKENKTAERKYRTSFVLLVFISNPAPFAVLNKKESVAYTSTQWGVVHVLLNKVIVLLYNILRPFDKTLFESFSEQ